jgi:preprotein translocase subunit YajC
VTETLIARSSGGSGFIFLILLLGLFVVLFVLPSRRRQRAQRQRLSEVEVGQEVLTVGGLIGKVVEAENGELKLEIAEGVVVRVARRGVATVLEPEEPAPVTEEPETPEDPS